MLSFDVNEIKCCVHFTGPKGEKGDLGPIGPIGPQGPQGND